MLLNLDNAPNPPYAIFEEVDIDSESKRFSVFLVGLGEEGITIGRNSNSTIVMKEISVSRNHC
jgi:pSer/pThr/pTyr-binding forkhead associated (FHA) protein